MITQTGTIQNELTTSNWAISKGQREHQQTNKQTLKLNNHIVSGSFDILL